MRKKIHLYSNPFHCFLLKDVGLEWVTIKRKLAIAVAANFENKNKDADFKFDDIGGKDVMKDLTFFTKLKEETEVDLENLVYIRGETHYFVMTGKKDNLISRGVLKEVTRMFLKVHFTFILFPFLSFPFIPLLIHHVIFHISPGYASGHEF